MMKSQFVNILAIHDGAPSIQLVWIQILVDKMQTYVAVGMQKKKRTNHVFECDTQMRVSFDKCTMKNSNFHHPQLTVIYDCWQHSRVEIFESQSNLISVHRFGCWETGSECLHFLRPVDCKDDGYYYYFGSLTLWW